MRFILLLLLILGSRGLAEKFQAESLYTLDFSQAEGDPVEWFEARGWEEKEDMDGMNPRFEKDRLVIEPKAALSGVFTKNFVDGVEQIKKVHRIRIEWGVEQYPEGADWSGSVDQKRNAREPISVMVFFGEEGQDSGSMFVPDIPYFLAFFLGEKERPGISYRGNYWQKGGRYFCISCDGSIGDFVTESELTSLFKAEFGMEPPPISGIAIEVDVSYTMFSNGRHSKAYLKKIVLLP